MSSVVTNFNLNSSKIIIKTKLCSKVIELVEQQPSANPTISIKIHFKIITKSFWITYFLIPYELEYICHFILEDNNIDIKHDLSPQTCIFSANSNHLPRIGLNWFRADQRMMYFCEWYITYTRPLYQLHNRLTFTNGINYLCGITMGHNWRNWFYKHVSSHKGEQHY